MQFFLLLISLVFAASAAQAQIVNIQAALSADLPEGPGLSAEVRQEKKTGNTESDRLTGQGTLTYSRPSDLWILLARREYSSEAGRSSADNRFLHLRYRYVLLPNWGWEAFAQEDSDRFRRSQQRTLLGTGPRYQYVFADRAKFALGVALMQERERFSERDAREPEPDRMTNRLANMLYLSIACWENCELSHVLYHQPALKSMDDQKTFNETSLSLQINKHLGLRISYNSRYNARPPEGVKKQDTTLVQSLTVKI